MKEVWDEKYKRIDEKLISCEKQIYNHDARIDRLEKICAEDRVMITNLCDQIKNLVTTIKWIGGPIIFGMIGFFFYAIQQVILK